MSTSDNLCFIPAKATSTRLPGKNTLLLNGRELVAHPILAAKESGIFGEEVIVSTESEKIKKIALSYGAKVPYMREERLARDPYQIKHVVMDFFEKNPEYRVFKTICVMLPTAPFVTAEDVRKAYEIYEREKLKVLFSVTESEHNALRAVFIRNNRMEPLFMESITKRSQELDKTYRINGAVVISNIAAFLATGTDFNFPAGAYIMPQERSIDIDTQFDYMMAKAMCQKGDLGGRL